MKIITITKVVLIIALLSINVYAKSKPKLFKEMSLQTDLTLSHPVYPLDLLPNAGQEILLIGTYDGQVYIEVFAVSEDMSYSIVKRIHVPNKFHAVDFTNWESSRQHVYFLSSQSIYKLNIQSNAPLEHIIDVSTYLQSSESAHLPQIDFVFDVNKDNKADFFTSDFSHGYLYQSDGEQYITQLLSLSAEVQLDGRNAEIKAPRFDFYSHTEQVSSELIRYENAKLTLIPDYTAEQSSQQIITMRNDIMVDDWWQSRGADGDSLDQSDLVYRKLEEVKDINNDGIYDLIVRYTRSQGALDRQNDYEIYLGMIEENKLVFGEKTQSVIKDDGTLTGLRLVDIDADNRYEALVSGFDIGISEIIGALLSGSLSQDVHLFYMNDQGNFTEDDKVTREVRLSFSISKGRSGSPVVMFADVNGDGKKDWVLSDAQKALKVYLAESNQKFARKPTKYKTLLPMQGNRVVNSDLNQDGKDDILMSFGRLDDKKVRQTIKILYSGS
jgi:hypothetical protein